MSNIEFVLDEAGVRELLRSGEAYDVCKSYADAVAARAGAGYGVGMRMYPERVGAAVSPYTTEAYDDVLKNNTLLKVLH